MSDAANTQPEKAISTSDLFNSALNFQQKNNLDEALNAYNQILHSKELTKDQASVAHHNLSIIYLQKKDIPTAQIENYLALAFNPSNSVAQQLNKTNEQFKNSIVQVDRTWSSTPALRIVPVEVFFVILLGCFFAMAKLLIFHLKSRAVAAHDNLDAPPLPLFLKILALVLILVAVVLGLRLYDENIVKAIVVKQNTEVLASAGANQALITTINPGLEVIVLRMQKIDDAHYIQVKSTGQFSGWVKDENIVITNPKKIQTSD